MIYNCVINDRESKLVISRKYIIENQKMEWSEETQVREFNDREKRLLTDDGLPKSKPKSKSKTSDFIKAHNRLLKEGRVSTDVRNHRLSICTGITVEGKKISEPCSSYKNEDKGWGSGHCKTCGCPDWPVSEMRRKTYYPLSCPVGKFSEMPGRRAKCKDSLDCSNGQSDTTAQVKAQLDLENHVVTDVNTE